MTPNQFYAKYNGVYSEESASLGAQCVWAFKLFCRENSIPAVPTPNNWADGYWTCQNANGTVNENVLAWQTQWFTKIQGAENFRDGDWVIWGRGGVSPSHNRSHIAMRITFNGTPYEFSLNQGGNGAFCAKETVWTDALGALRWKGYEKMNIEKGYHRLEYKGITVDIVRATKANGYDLHLLSAGDAFALQDLMEFDSDRLGIVSAVNANYFDNVPNSSTFGMHLGCEGDGWVNGYFQAPKSTGILSYYITDQGTIGAHDQSDFWLGQEQIQVVCAPYSVLIHEGKNTDLHSASFGNKDLVRNTQTCAMRIGEDWCLAIFSACYPSDVHAFAQECGANELILMDSGGSSQMFECATTGKRRAVKNTGRKIPNVLVLAKRLGGNEPPVPEDPTDPEPDPDPAPGPVPDPDPDPDPDPAPDDHPSGWTNEFFDIMRYMSEIGIPALAVLVATIGQILGLPNADKISAVLMAISVFVGSLVNMKRSQYNAKAVKDDA